MKKQSQLTGMERELWEKRVQHMRVEAIDMCVLC